MRFSLWQFTCRKPCGSEPASPCYSRFILMEREKRGKQLMMSGSHNNQRIKLPDGFPPPVLVAKEVKTGRSAMKAADTLLESLFGIGYVAPGWKLAKKRRINVEVLRAQEPGRGNGRRKR